MKITSVITINGEEIRTTAEGNPTEEEMEMFKQTEDLFQKYMKEGLIPATLNLKFEFEE